MLLYEIDVEVGGLSDNHSLNSCLERLGFHVKCAITYVDNFCVYKRHSCDFRFIVNTTMSFACSDNSSSFGSKPFNKALKAIESLKAISAIFSVRVKF